MNIRHDVLRRGWQSMASVVLGFCLVISPWELDYAAAMMPTTNAVVTGLLLILLSLSVDWRQAPRRAKPSLRAGHAASHGGSPGGRGGCRP